jgi:hypothetical protein
VNDFHERPKNVCRVVNIVSHGPCLGCAPLAEADENHDVPGTWHLGAPRHDTTLQVLAHELARVAATVPSGSPPPEPVPGNNEPPADAK